MINQLANMISRAGQYYADRVALVSDEHRLTFSQVNARSSQLARALSKAGVKKGDRIGILLPNCAEFVESDFALIKSGLVRLPINSRLKPPEYEYMLNDAQANTLIFGSEFAEDVEKLRPSLESVTTFIQVGSEPADFATGYEHILAQEADDDFAVDVTPEDNYQILYTSGTTGKPKGAVTSFRSRISTLATVLIDEIQVKPNDALLASTPLAHGGGTKILPHFVRGAKTVLMSKYSPEGFCERVEKEKITTTWVVPTMITTLLASDFLDKYDLSSLKMVVYAAAPMPEATIRQAIARFGPIFQQGYGLSEAPNPILSLSRDDHIIEGTEAQVRRLQSAGKGVYGVSHRVVDTEGKDVAPGEVGEIIVTGDNIMTGYWNRPEATAETIIGGWLYTGDMAMLDDEGYVFIVDRRKDLIISGGFNVYPREIEEVIYAHPAVLEAAVIGIPDPQWGETVKAFVTCRQGHVVEEAELLEFIGERLSGYKKPKSVSFMEELPKSPTGKILKRELKDKFWAGRARMVN